MRNKLAAISVALAGVLAVSAPMLAHHGNASYDATKTVTVTGTVTDYIWSNPHVLLKLDAKSSGKTLHWIIEAQNPLSQTQVGWTKDTFKPGDKVTVEVLQAKNGLPVGRFGAAGAGAGLATQESLIVINGKQFKP